MENEKKKGFFAMIWESMTKTGGCCGSGETCWAPLFASGIIMTIALATITKTTTTLKILALKFELLVSLGIFICLTLKWENSQVLLLTITPP